MVRKGERKSSPKELLVTLLAATKCIRETPKILISTIRDMAYFLMGIELEIGIDYHTPSMHATIIASFPNGQWTDLSGRPNVRYTTMVWYSTILWY